MGARLRPLELDASQGRRDFPNTAALLPLTTAVLVEQDDEWPDGRRHFC
jgi:hypothetical protein